MVVWGKLPNANYQMVVWGKLPFGSLHLVVYLPPIKIPCPQGLWPTTQAGLNHALPLVSDDPALGSRSGSLNKLYLTNTFCNL